MQIKRNKNCNIVVNGQAVERNQIKRSNSDEIVPFNFQPMPKRFMVWRKDYQQFAKKVLSGGIREYVYALPEMGFYYNDPDCIICQSTNLFDKDGREIFEGSILQKAGRNHLVVIEDGKAMCAGVPQSSLKAMAKHGRVVGHILSNPELLEGR